MAFAGTHGEKCINKDMIPGLRIVMTGYAGLEEAASLAEGIREELGRRFSDGYIDRMTSCDIPGDIGDILLTSVYALDYYPVGEGCILAGLWEVCSELNCGMHVDIKDIPIRQETVEICNLLDADPYEMKSGGVYIVLAQNARALTDELSLEGIDAADIGYLTIQAAKEIAVGDTVRYLNKPKEDTK